MRFSVTSINDKKINSIQLLRGLAALAVVIHHLIGNDKIITSPLVKGIADQGFKGVQVFFVISGFIIPYSLYKSNYQYSDFKTFILKRIVRIEPPYILSIVLVLFLNYSNTLSPWYSGPAFTIDWVNTIGHLAYLNAFTHWPWINMVYWTLAIEFEFYILISLLFPLLVSINKKYQALGLFILLACAFAPINNAHILYHLPFFGLGIGLCLYAIGKLSLKESLAVMFLFSIQAFVVFDWTYLAVGLLTTLCIVSIKNVPKPFMFLGTISYSLYLVHPPIVTRVVALTARFLPQANHAIAVFLSLVITLLCATIFYLLIEKPFIALSKKVFAAKKPVMITDSKTSVKTQQRRRISEPV